VPELFRYIKMACDERNERGLFSLSGSQPLLLMKSASDSLSGRVCILEMLTLSLREIQGDTLIMLFISSVHAFYIFSSDLTKNSHSGNIKACTSQHNSSSMKHDRISGEGRRLISAGKKRITWKKIRNNFVKNRYMYLMLLPVVAYFGIFKYWPMVWLRMAFYKYKLLKGFEGSKYVGLAHFTKFFNSMDFWMLLRNTLTLNALSLVLVFPVPILFALLLNEIGHARFKKLVQTVSYLPYFISTMILVSMINTFLSPSLGIVNRIIRSLGGEAIYFLGKARYFRGVYIASGIWQGTGWGAIVYLSALTSIDTSLYEAAVVDGAGRWKQTLHITLPGIRSTIVIMFILEIGHMMNVGFEKVYLLQNDLNISVSEVISTYLYKKGIIQADYSYSTAVGLFNAVVNFSLVLISNTISRKLGETSLW